jgi:predicted chitinase
MIFGVHTESLDDIPTSALPWAICLGHGAAVSGIGNSGSPYVEGTLVSLYFQDGESKQQPMIMGSLPGVPIKKSPFESTTEEVSTLSSSNVTSTLAPTSSNTLSDTSGKPVLDSSGSPIKTDVTATGCCDLVDASKMIAQYGSNVSIVCQALCDYGIKDPYAIVAILSNIAKECGFKPKRESLVYTTLSRLRIIFSSKFASMSDADASSYLNNEAKLSNFVYSNKNGNGSVDSGDGYNYRGGGYIQLTFKNNYLAVGKLIGSDLVGNPALTLDISVAAKIVAGYFITRFGGAHRIKFSSLNDALVTITKKVNPGGFANDYPIVQKASLLCKILQDDAKIADDKATDEITKPNAPENDLKKDATKKEIDSGIVGGSTKIITSKSGFTDPQGKYPLDSLLKEPDTNRLARRNTKNTSVQKRMSAKRSGIRSIGSTFDEPSPAYNAQYPYNHVRATESGHIQEFDDTPGRERIQTYHTSGTYQEVDKYGNRVNKIIGDDFTIIERNGYLYVDGTLRITAGSSVKFVIGGNADIEVDGNLTWDVGGDVTIKSGGDFKVGAGGKFSFSANADSSFDAPNIDINSGVSEALAVSGRSGNSNDYPRLIPENFLDAETIFLDDNSGDVDAAHAKAIKEGTMTQGELDAGKKAAENPEKVDNAAPPVVEGIPQSCSAFAGKTDIPDSTQLSKNFTLAMVSTKAKAGGHKVAPQHSLTESQIVCNLKMVSENCADPIKAQYPNMYITSGFRPGSSSSQHELGQALDMQFDVPNEQYFEIAQWIKNNVVFDKLLLEYKTNRSGKAWIHVAYRENPRREVYTFMNDKNTGAGLRKLQ